MGFGGVLGGLATLDQPRCAFVFSSPSGKEWASNQFYRPTSRHLLIFDVSRCVTRSCMTSGVLCVIRDLIRREHTFWRLRYGKEINLLTDNQEGDPTDLFGPTNIIHPKTIDQNS